jgi:hypothetical protein
MNGSIPVVGGQLPKTWPVRMSRPASRAHRAGALVLVLDPHRLAGPGWGGAMAAAAGLDRGFRVDADDMLVCAEPLAVEGSGVEVQHDGGLGGEVGVSDEDPGFVLPGFDRVLRQDPAHAGGRDRADHAPRDQFGCQLRAGPVGQWHAGGGGQLAGQRADLSPLQRADPAGLHRPGPVGQTRQAVLGEPGPPLAGGVGGDTELAGDLGVGPAPRGEQDDPGA